MKYRKWGLLLIIISGIVLFIVGINEKTSKTSSEPDLKTYEKGYDLPVPDVDRAESETECKEAMESIRKVYESISKETFVNEKISKESAIQYMEILKKLDSPISVAGNILNMFNYEKMEEFLKRSLNSKKTEIVTYEVHTDGGITRRKFSFDGQEMYVLDSNGVWNEGDKPFVTNTSYTRIKDWEYTEKGWFSYEYCVPEPPEVTEIIDGNVMVRVKPLEAKYRDIAVKYLSKIGYTGNNLFRSNWDAEQMKELDYNGLFEYLYVIKHQQRFDSKPYEEGIPKVEFENLMMEYLPISVEQLREYAAFDAEKESYAWGKLGCGNYTPNAIGTSFPEITAIKVNEDGTVTLTIDAVCEMLGKDAIFTHELMIQFLENGGVKYLSNRILGDGMEQISGYQYRFK